jgi:hypothetical protein
MHVLVHYKPADRSVHIIDPGSHKEFTAFIPKKYQKTQMNQGAFDMNFSSKMTQSSF